MIEKLIFLDLDKTMVNHKQELTDVAVFKLISSLTKKGWMIGLNSDRPYETLRDYHDSFCLNGPIVSEAGNATYLPNPWQKLSENCELKKKFARLKSALIQHITNQHPEAQLLVGESQRLLELLTEIKSAFPLGLFVVINNLRKFSFSLNVRKLTNRKMIMFDELLRQLSDFAIATYSEIFGEEPSSYVEYQEYGSCILHCRQSRKGNPIKLIIEALKPDFVAMIGDSAWDMLDDPRVIQCAVGNAEEAYKKQCQFVALSPLTVGVRECLEWLKTI